MADIKTEKKSVLLVGQNNEAQMGVVAMPGRVCLLISNEGVAHKALLTPEEATTLGVQLIRLGQTSSIMDNTPTPPMGRGIGGDGYRG